MKRPGIDNLTRLRKARRVPICNLSGDVVARSVTHELRQSLSVISGYAELLANVDLSAVERAVLVDEIRQAARRIDASLEVLERTEPVPLISLGTGERAEVLDLRGRTRRPR